MYKVFAAVIASKKFIYLFILKIYIYWFILSVCVCTPQLQCCETVHLWIEAVSQNTKYFYNCWSPVVLMHKSQ